MRGRLAAVLICALIMASAASYVVYSLAGSQNSRRRSPTSRILVAVRGLETGALIQEADLRIADWPGTPPKGSIAVKSEAMNRGVISPIYEGEPIAENRLARAGSGAGLAATIPPGMRACAVRVNDVVGVAGFVTPGMRVDVLITGAPPGEATSVGPAVRTLLQNIEVLSAGVNIEKDREGKPQQVQVVNLLVTPRQAETLSLAGNETHIQLVLRNPADVELTAPPGSSMADLFGTRRVSPATPSNAVPLAKHDPVVQPPRPPAPKLATIEVLNGQKRTEVRFPAEEESQ
ncbi:MAG TPA: Flp pilus assembly protein CpaB [Bryobacteraceae bacterium]|jgi:pilus assembly protein CpaB|nr:Flp pilus assembly protein CpaB [Bryobacteraceae bacterium]